MQSFVFALASCLATACETLLFNRLTVLRTHAHAGDKGPAPSNSFAALPIQLVCVLFRRPFNLGLQVALSGAGVHPSAAGGIAGLAEGVVFTPTRRVQIIQMAATERLSVCEIVRDILDEEGWRGLWKGGLVNIIRCGVAGAVYFAVMTACRAHLPGAGHLVQGAIAAGCATLTLNPAEVLLTRLYLKRQPPKTLADLARGLGLCLARNVPGGAMRWWLTQSLATWILARL